MSARLRLVFACLLAGGCASHGLAQAPVPLPREPAPAPAPAAAAGNATAPATAPAIAASAVPAIAPATATAPVLGELAPTLGHLAGRVMLRKTAATGGGRLEFPKAGRRLEEGEVLITGDQSLFELRVGEAGWWRVGRRAVLAAQAGGGGRLTAGTALVRVPKGASWRIDAARGSARLAAGLWLLQAVDNEGLKIVCLDGPAELWALGEPAAPQPPKARAAGGGRGGRGGGCTGGDAGAAGPAKTQPRRAGVFAPGRGGVRADCGDLLGGTACDEPAD